MEGNYWNIPTLLKDKVYYMPAIGVCSRMLGSSKEEERKLHTTEMRTLRWARGQTRLDHVRNVDIWKEAHIYPMTEVKGEIKMRPRERYYR